MKNQSCAWLLLLFSACTPQPASNQNNTEETKPATVFTPAEVIQVYGSDLSSDARLAEMNPVPFTSAAQPLEREVSVYVDPSHSFQTFMGVGGAITDASAEVFAQLSPEKQAELLDAYFSASKGIGYTVLRTSIHSCDFSSGSFTYIEEGDSTLSTFSIAHDQRYRLPMIKRAYQKIGDAMTFYVSPWSPPAFMKSNGNMLRGGSLLPQFRQAWANYYVKFIQAYEAEGLPVWGLTIQNEPMAVQTWESCIYTAEEERDFLKLFLGPTLEKAGMGDKKIVVWDHNRDLLAHRAFTILDDPEASRFVWGVGFHWYETWAKGNSMWENLRVVKEAYPAKQLIFTEGCNEKFDATQYHRWSNAERYGKSMINDFNAGTVAWTDWNILLDQNGGPNHVGNFCFSPIHADTRTGELIYTPAYAYIGHFSKYIQKGAKRVAAASSHSSLMVTSFQNPDGKMVTVVMNETDSPVSFNLVVGDRQAPLQLPAHGIQSLVY